MDKFYHITFSIKYFRLSENFLFLHMFGQFLEFGGAGCVWQYMDSQKLSHQFLLILLMVSYLLTNLYSCLSIETLYFLHSLYSSEKLKKWCTFKSCVTEIFWSLKNLQTSQKRKVICYVLCHSHPSVIYRHDSLLFQSSFCLYLCVK